MPFIDAECLTCGVAQTTMCAAISGPYPPCEECGGELKKLISPAMHQDLQLTADREYEAAGPGERFLQQKQLEDVATNAKAGKVGKITVGDRWPSALKPKALQLPKTG